MKKFISSLLCVCLAGALTAGTPIPTDEFFSEETFDTVESRGGKADSVTPGQITFESPTKTISFTVIKKKFPVAPYAVINYQFEGTGTGKMGFIAAFYDQNNKRIGSKAVMATAKDGKFALSSNFRIGTYKGNKPAFVNFDAICDKGAALTVTKFTMDYDDKVEVKNTVTPTKRSDWAKGSTDNLTYSASRQKDVPIMFLGDSITYLWAVPSTERYPGGKEVWDKTFAPLKAVNYGISGDQIENVLWRVTTGKQLACNPKIIVLLIGTNNLHQPALANTPGEVVDGIVNLVNEIQKQLPETKILLCGILPRNQYSWLSDFCIPEINDLLSKHAWNDKVTYKDYSKLLLGPTGTIDKKIFRDGIHLSPAGYELWAPELLKDILAIQAK